MNLFPFVDEYNYVEGLSEYGLDDNNCLVVRETFLDARFVDSMWSNSSEAQADVANR